MEAITDTNRTIPYIINVCTHRSRLDKSIFYYNNDVLRDCDTNKLQSTLEALKVGPTMSVPQAQVALHIECILYERMHSAINNHIKDQALTDVSGYMIALLSSVDTDTLEVLSTGDSI